MGYGLGLLLVDSKCLILNGLWSSWGYLKKKSIQIFPTQDPK